MFGSMLLEAYAGDPSWASKGDASTRRPADIRAGRVVVELYDKEVGRGNGYQGGGKRGGGAGVCVRVCVFCLSHTWGVCVGSVCGVCVPCTGW